MQEELFCQALGLAQPWSVQRVALDVAHSRIDLYVVWNAKSAACPACGTADQRVHDHHARSWRHLDFFQFEAHVSVTTQFDGSIITFRDGHFGETFKQNSVGISTDAVLHGWI